MTAHADVQTRANSGRAFALSLEFKAFITRLHFYAGLLVGPFILIAALTGTLYVLTPQIEHLIYREQLTATAVGEPASLAAQVEAARRHIGDGPRFFAIRPAPRPGETTRVMFAQAGLGDSESRAIFVDPVSLAVKGDLIAYGTSGILPFRIQLDYLHRNLLLGEFGRNYSELAASWLWAVVLGGSLMWFWRRNPKAAERVRINPALRDRRWHGLIGLTLSLGLVFLSVTGLTWSKHAGDRIDALRANLGWVTPSVSLKLGAAPAVGGEHAHHGDHGPAVGGAAPGSVGQLDAVFAAAKAAGIDSGHVEIRPPRGEGQAWLVREYDRSWPTQVDTLALDPRDLAVVSRADFETFPLVAKLIRWGIDAHMGVLFGWPNQLLMALLGFGLMVATVLGYRIWWRQRPAPGGLPRTLLLAWLRLGWPGRAATIGMAAALGWALPLVGFSLTLFCLVDLARWRLSRPA
ncbi:PepSY-associated TM helix domain-containing protein [Bosea rubneri]|uniref:PepSY-associated TM helix domain-containing protein n=1 Tax=Bosea rubneri TaxID=3075434 RepID=A0ABU3SCE3_9HYPH|nr:PepSY-associated TM helix domain-containing protein [Bosea sp. ZW T0_25]MDU0342445.1 PepSY-associated TM helix domain-containing protein [Bosea sp. ZW T0_25]